MYLFLKFMAALPLNFLQSFAACVAWLMFNTHSNMRRITTINIGLAYPELDAAEQQALVKRSLISQGKTFLEFIKCWGNSADYSLNQLKEIHGAEHFVEALANKKGVILVVPHLGSWELLNAWINLYAKDETLVTKHKEERTMKVHIDNLVFCEDCMLAAVNNDYTGLDYHYNEQEAEQRQAEIVAGLSRLSALGSVCLAGIAGDEFSTRPCDCCGSHLAGSREYFIILA